MFQCKIYSPGLNYSIQGLLFGPLIGSFAALVSPDFVAWLSAIIFGALLLGMLLFLDETADCTNTSATQQENAEGSGGSCGQGNIRKLQRTSMLETTLHVLHLSTYPNVAVPVIVYSWTWYLVSSSHHLDSYLSSYYVWSGSCALSQCFQ